MPQRVEGDCADAVPDLVAAFGVGVARVNQFAQTPERGLRFAGVGVGQHRNELVAAETADDVAVTKGIAQQLGKRGEGNVALRVPEPVIDLLETIQVEEQQRRRLVHALADIERMLRQRLETATVGQHGQLVHRRQLDGGQLLLGHARQIAQQFAVIGTQAARLDIDQAQRAQLAPIGDAQWTTGVEADVGRAGHERVVVEALIGQRVRDRQDLVTQDRVAAKRDIARGLAHGKAQAGLEPLAIGVHQADQRDGHPEQPLGQASQPVEAFFRRRIQDIKRAQRIDSCGLIRGQGGGKHGEHQCP